MFVYVGGIPGVGKTTVIAVTIKLAQETNFSIQSMDEKKILCQITGVKSTEDYAKLPEKIRSEARRQMVAYFYELDENGPMIIRIRDDHFVTPKEDGTWFIRPYEESDKKHMIAFVVIVAEPQVILKMRLTRMLVYSEPGFIDSKVIIQHQRMEIQIASQQAEYLKIPFKVLKNEEGKITQTAQLLLSFIKEVTKGVKH